MSPQEFYIVTTVLTLALLICAWRTYIAWLKPDEHQAFLEFWGGFFDGWLPSAQAYWTSSFNAWLMRISFTLGFFVALGILAILIFRFGDQ
jgi:hypothetical protein